VAFNALPRFALSPAFDSEPFFCPERLKFIAPGRTVYPNQTSRTAWQQNTAAVHLKTSHSTR
jgi:hypothetical protein